MKKFSKLLLIALLSFSSMTAFAYDGDVSINSNEIQFSTSRFLEGNAVRIYATAVNHSNKDLLGVVRFYANDRQIGGDQPISIFANKTDDIFIDWTPLSWGTHLIKVKLMPWQADIDDPQQQSCNQRNFCSSRHRS